MKSRKQKRKMVRWQKMQVTPCKSRIEALSYIVLQNPPFCMRIKSWRLPSFAAIVVRISMLLDEAPKL